AAMSLGVIEECLRLSVEYAKTRELWGQRIGDFQLIQLKLAKMEVARLNVQNLVFRHIEMQRAGRSPSLAEASAMKLYSAQAANEVAQEAVQLFGGNGYMAEYRVEQLARDAKSFQIYAGTDENQVPHIARGLVSPWPAPPGLPPGAGHGRAPRRGRPNFPRRRSIEQVGGGRGRSPAPAEVLSGQADDGDWILTA